MRETRIDRNAEGYPEYAFAEAYKNIRREEKERKKEKEFQKTMETIGRLVAVIKQAADLAGFEVVGRITFRDKKTGKEYH